MPALPTSNEIRLFFHCRECIKELGIGKSPREYPQLEVGFTKWGVQVWCKRHELNVIHIDFEGRQHPTTPTI